MNVEEINELFEGIDRDQFLKPIRDPETERIVDAMLDSDGKVRNGNRKRKPSLGIDWNASLSEFPKELKKRAEKEIMDFVYDGIEPSREVIYCIFAIIINHNCTHGKKEA